MRTLGGVPGTGSYLNHRSRGRTAPARGPSPSISLLSGRSRRIIPLTVVALLAVCWCGAASAGLGDEKALAKQYAPVVRLVTQEQDCGPGEPYRPIDVDVLFGADTVSLRGPWNRTDLIAIGPTATQLGTKLYGYHLDFPGDALNPGCSYEQWERAITAGSKPTVYAHVATEAARPGKLALQYWLFYVFNDWNNPHEGDWEMIQLDFDAATAAEALHRRPVEVGYSQHEGAERASWGDSKLELVDGTHPVVHVAAGSHANFFGQALYLGSSASQGVGCDDTRAPAFDVRPVVETIPGDPGQAHARFPWIGFQGRWGELQRAFYNGPTGPNLKQQWTEPIQWSEGWRDRSYAVPVGGVLGTRTTDFFCGAVAGGSDVLRRLVHEPRPVLLVLAALIALVLLGLSRATWRPTAPLDPVRRRAWGQIIAASARMYRRRIPLFVGIGLLLVPITVIIALLQTIILKASNVAGISTEGQGGGLLVLILVGLGAALTLLGVGLVQVATARAVVEIAFDRPVSPLRAYRLAASSVRPLLAALVIAAVTVVLLAGSLFLIPIAVWLAVRWALIAPAIALEGLSGVEALRRSYRLVRQRWLKVGSLTILGAAVALVAGPLVGSLLILFTSAPLPMLDLVAGIIYAVSLPFVALTTAYVYFDTRVRDELTAPTGPDELPAEIDLGAGPATGRPAPSAGPI